LPDADQVIRYLEDVQLYDVGPVVFPAYKGTSVAVVNEDWGRSVRRRVSARGANDRASAILAQLGRDLAQARRVHVFPSTAGRTARAV
jgi:hypothetical protein